MQIKFLTGGALAAVAAALALTAAPAAARENERHNNHGQHERSARTPSDYWQTGQVQTGQVQANQAPQARPQQRSWTPQARPQQQPEQARQQRGWTPQARQQWQEQGRGRDRQQWQERTRDRQQWQERTQERPQWQDPGRQRRDYTYGQQIERGERNRTYADRDRNTTYRNTTESWRERRDNYDRYRDGRRDNQRWDRNWRSNNRYDWQRYRSSNRNAYHVGRYYAPYRNYSYRRLGIGFRLDSLFFGSNYWINDPFYYRLPEVYGPYRWVRYYDDALLVDIYSGEVVDVIYDFFW